MENKYKLLQYVASKSDYITNSELQKILNVSRRSIINYIMNLNEEYPGLILSTNKGYLISNSKLASSIINSEKLSSDITGYEMRKKYLLEILLLSNENPTITDLSDELFVSSSTINSDINQLKQELHNENLYIKVKNNRINIIGEDKHRRRYIMKLLNNELEESHFSENSLQSFFNFVDLNIIKNIVQKTIDKFNFFIDDFSYLNYVLHLAICIESSINSNGNTVSLSTNYQMSPHSYKIVADIFLQLKQIYNYNYTFEQIYEMSIIMSTRIRSKNIHNLSFNEIDKIVDISTKELLIEIVTYVHEFYGIDLKKDNFMVRFALHLKNVIARVNNNINIPYNNFITIKKDYPFLYVIAIFIASIINKKVKSPLSENEISYIALHLGVLMEEKKTYDTNINCVLVIYDYYNIGKTIFNNISNNVCGLYLMDIVSGYEKINKEEPIDLILTTLPIDNSIDIPTVKISVIPSQTDYDNIAHEANIIKQTMTTKHLLWNIKRLFKKDLFFVNTSFTDYTETIDFACSKIEELGYVNKEFKNAILEHEKFIPSAYQNIAIPHPLADDLNTIKNSSITVIINSTPINWVNNHVDCVFMLSLKKEDCQLFKTIFNLLIELDYNDFSTVLKKCNDYNSFLNILLKKH